MVGSESIKAKMERGKPDGQLLQEQWESSCIDEMDNRFFGGEVETKGGKEYRHHWLLAIT